MATKVIGGVTLEQTSRPTSAIRVGGSPPATGSERLLSSASAPSRYIGDLGILKTTDWRVPDRPQGLSLNLDTSSGSSCDLATAKVVYEASVRGDAAALAAALATLRPQPPDGEDAAEAPEGDEAPSKPPFPKITDVYGLEPLALAAGSNHADAVAALLDAGADVNAQQPVGRGDSALHRAARGGHASVISTLIEHGAKASLAAADGSTPLHLASQRGHAEAVTALLAAPKIDHSAADLVGRTPLMMAAKGGHMGVVELLLDASAETDSADSNGWTALLLACQGQHAAVAELLGARGADIKAKTKGERTAAMLAPALFDRLQEQAEERAEAYFKEAEDADAAE